MNPNANPNGTDALFDIIRKELNSIIEHGEKKLEAAKADKKQSKIGSGLKKHESDSSISKGNTIVQTNNNDTQSMKEKHESPMASNRLSAGDSMDDVNKQKLSIMQSKFKSTLEKDIANQTAFLNSPRTKNIDADLQRMQIELQDSYNLFQGISEKFESINFHNLQKRIKELNLVKKREAVGSARADDLREVVEEGFKTNRMKELTKKVGEKFNKHPGEFGNIPELSTFFQACTQLEQVLGNLKRQHTDAYDLEDRMRKAAQISYNRMNHIKKQLEEMKSEQQTQEDSKDI